MNALHPRRKRASHESPQARRAFPWYRRLVIEPLEDRRLLALAPLLVDLQPGSDSGKLSDDNLTNVRAPVIDITARRRADTIPSTVRACSWVRPPRSPTTLLSHTSLPGNLSQGTNSITARDFDGCRRAGIAGPGDRRSHPWPRGLRPASPAADGQPPREHLRPVNVTFSDRSTSRPAAAHSP